MKHRLAITFVLAAAVLGGAAPAAGRQAARRYTEVASAGDVQASFSYTYDTAKSDFSNPTLQITRAGTLLLNGAVAAPPNESYARVWPANFWQKTKSVFARDLDGDGEPEVFLALFSGGAHCCYFTYLYRYVNGAYQRVYHLWGDPGYKLRDLNADGRPEFVSGDDRFAYAFASFADSAWPVRIFDYEQGRFVDVTRSFPAQIRADARRIWPFVSTAIRQRRSTYGILAAWTADECLLHHSAYAFRKLGALRKQGKLRGDPYNGSPKTYLHRLRRFLAKTGYLRSAA